jgi:hypothetical protein
MLLTRVSSESAGEKREGNLQPCRSQLEWRHIIANNIEIMSESPTTWPDLAASLFEKLTGRGAEITYEFQNLEVHVPNVMGAEAKHAHWKLNGVVKIRTRENVTK